MLQCCAQSAHGRTHQDGRAEARRAGGVSALTCSSPFRSRSHSKRRRDQARVTPSECHSSSETATACYLPDHAAENLTNNHGAVLTDSTVADSRRYHYRLADWTPVCLADGREQSPVQEHYTKGCKPPFAPESIKLILFLVDTRAAEARAHLVCAFHPPWNAVSLNS
jgi:hypothetical protein